MQDMNRLKEICFDKKILYVEDEAHLCEANKEALELFCGNVFIATNGEEGLDIFKENQDINLVLTDITMPKMTGMEMASKIKELNPNVKIIARTSHSEQYLRDEFPEHDYNELLDKVLNKPFDFMDLIEIIEDYI